MKKFKRRTIRTKAWALLHGNKVVRIFFGRLLARTECMIRNEGKMFKLHRIVRVEIREIEAP